MPSYTTADLRNVAITGHSGAGKTTLVEAVLHKLGMVERMGEVEKGDTVCDYEQEEKEREADAERTTGLAAFPRNAASLPLLLPGLVHGAQPSSPLAASGAACPAPDRTSTER